MPNLSLHPLLLHLPLLRLPLLRSLSHPLFARLYVSQAINSLGDALTWVGLALLVVNLGGDSAPAILSVALTLRVSTFVLVAPWAGALADRVDRKWLLTGAHLLRMIMILALAGVTQIWQLYGLLLLLNAGTAVFTPTYKATIPLVTGKADYPQAIALANATNQMLGVVGPILAGVLAALCGSPRQIFLLDGLSFLLAAILIVTLPAGLTEKVRLEANSTAPVPWNFSRIWQEISLGSRYLFAAAPLRYALGMQFVAAIAGAEVLVNTVSHVTGKLHGTSWQYGWVMAAYGLGAALAAVVLGWWESRQIAGPKLPESGLSPAPPNLLPWIGVGAVLMAASLLVADPVGWQGLLGLWLLAGMGESWINVPTQTLLADCIPAQFQGRVYGAHYAWSHLWWVVAYPVAGWLGSLSLTEATPVPIFFWGGLLGLGVGLVVQVVGWVNRQTQS